MRLLVFLVFISSALANEALYEILRNKLNYNINPCDNFFAHVCSNIKRNRDLMSSQLQYNMEEMVGQYLPREHVLFERKNKLDMLLSSQNDLSWPEYHTFLLDRCNTKGSIERLADEYNKLTTINITKIATNGSCPDIVDRIRRQIANPNFQTQIQKDFQNMVSTPDGLANSIAYYSYIAQLGSTFSDAEEKMNEIFEKLRNRLYTMMEETPWIKNRGMLKVLQNQVYAVTLYRWNHNADTFRPALEKLHEYYKDCTENVITGMKPTEVFMCLTNAAHHARSELDHDAESIIGSILYWNAFFRPDNRQVTMLPLFYDFNNTDLITMMGAAGTVMGHELGHSIYQGVEVIDKCLIRNSKKSCELFSTKVCHSGEATQTEDAADWSGIRTSLDVIKEIEASSNSSLSEGPNEANEFNLTSNQYFFYSFTAHFCSHAEGHQKKENAWDVHSSHVMRMNAVLRMFTEFHEAFECQSGDAMFTGEDEKCNLAGPDAA